MPPPNLQPRPPLRCHLLIGPPASGKSSLAAALLPLLTHPDRPTPVLLSSGEPLQERLKLAIASGQPVIVEACHTSRAQRLALIQAMRLPAPVEWIGWWLTTPLATCQRWNAGRGSRALPDQVLADAHGELHGSKVFRPSRQEGFASLVEVDPTSHTPQELEQLLRTKLAGLATSIAQARKRSPRRNRLHGYSRLLDFERLLHVLQLLSEGHGLTAPAVAAILQERHGSCYADVAAIQADLDWLETQGFGSAMPVTTPVLPPPCTVADQHNGGWCAYGDSEKFSQLLTFIRHLLHHPFEHPRATDDDQIQAIHPTTRQSAASNKQLYAHLGRQLTALYPDLFPWGGWMHSLHNDITDVIHPYQLSSGHARKGFTIGTALLNEAELIEMHSIVLDATTRQHDPSPAGYELRDKLSDCLPRAGIAIDERLPVRATANRSIVDPELVAPTALTRHARQLEQAIVRREQIVIARLSHAGRFQPQDSAQVQAAAAGQGPWTVWPLQLLFHNIAWYLAYEKQPEPGHAHGLIKTDRLDWLEWRSCATPLAPPRSYAEQQASVALLHRLIKRSGGIHFGGDPALQRRIGGSSAKAARAAMTTLRFRCNQQVFPFFVAGSARFPGQMRLSKRRPHDPWRHRPDADALHQIAPDLNDDDHPYPVEIKLPPWTLREDFDFRRWLFGFGNAIYIEQPEELRIMQVNQARQLIDTITAKAEAENQAKVNAWNRRVAP
jgi:predicted kinase